MTATNIDSKKRRERKLFNYIYGDRKLYEVKPYENPDFLVRYDSKAPYFGVEVTECFLNETEARIKYINGYTADLLAGKDFRHKDDKKLLTISEVDIIRPDGTTCAKSIPAVIRDNAPLIEYARATATRIRSKSQLLQQSTAKVSHTNLIINDKTNPLYSILKAEFYCSYFIPELISAITSEPFHEIFLITFIEKEHVYIPLKMNYLLAEIFYLNGIINDYGIIQNIPTNIDFIDLFASYLNDIMSAPVFVATYSDGKEIIFGDSGIMIREDFSVIIRLHHDFLITPNSYSPSLDWLKILGADFLSRIENYRKTHKFSADTIFPINKSDTNIIL